MSVEERCQLTQVGLHLFSEKKMDLGLNVYFNTLSGLDEENMVG